jgi:hypothetical protein
VTTILTEPAAARTALDGLLQNYSLDVPQLEAAADIIPHTKIAITFLPNEDFPAHVAAAAACGSSASCPCLTFRRGV